MNTTADTLTAVASELHALKRTSSMLSSIKSLRTGFRKSSLAGAERKSSIVSYRLSSGARNTEEKTCCCDDEHTNMEEEGDDEKVQEEEVAPGAGSNRASLVGKLLRSSSNSIRNLSRRSTFTATKATAEEPAATAAAASEEKVEVQDLVASLEAQAVEALKEEAGVVETTVHHSKHKDHQFYVVKVDNRESETKGESSLMGKFFGRSSKSSSRSPSRRGTRTSEQGRRYIAPVQRSRRSTAASTSLSAAVEEPPVVLAALETEAETALNEEEDDIMVQQQKENKNCVMDHILQKEKRRSVLSHIEQTGNRRSVMDEILTLNCDDEDDYAEVVERESAAQEEGRSLSLDSSPTTAARRSTDDSVRRSL